MKKFIGVIFGVMLLLSAVAIAQEKQRESVGIKPDSAFYFLDRWEKSISLAFTSGNDAKIEKRLEIAKERLNEAKLMAEKGDVKSMRKAEAEHALELEKVREGVSKSDDNDSTKSLEKKLELETRIREHSASVDELKAIVKVQGGLTDDQKNQILAIVESMKGKSGQVEIEVENGKERIKIKIKQETGKTDDQINEIEIELRDKAERSVGAGFVDGVKVRAETEGTISIVKLETKFETTTTDKTALVNEILDKFSLTKEQAESGLRIETGDIGNDNDRLEIKVKNKDAKMEVEVKLRFLISSTDRATLVSEIEKRTKLDKTAVQTAVETGELRQGNDDNFGDDRGRGKETGDDRRLSEKEIEIEIERSTARVKIQTRGVIESQFVVNSTNLGEIYSAIAQKTGMTLAEVKAIARTEDSISQNDLNEDNGIDRRRGADKPEDDLTLSGNDDRDSSSSGLGRGSSNDD